MNSSKDIKMLYPLWDKGLSPYTNKVRFFGLEPKDMNFIHASYVEYMGGAEEVIKKTEEQLKQIFHAQDGGYDFNFKVTNYIIKSIEQEGYLIPTIGDFNYLVDPKGEVTIHAFSDAPTVSFNYLYDEMDVEADFVWEVGHEILDICNDTIFIKVLKNSGMIIRGTMEDDKFEFGPLYSDKLEESLKNIKRLL